MTNGSGVCSLILCGGEGDAVQLFVLKELLVGFLFFFFFKYTCSSVLNFEKGGGNVCCIWNRDLQCLWRLFFPVGAFSHSGP